jgi:hypothetical protein
MHPSLQKEQGWVTNNIPLTVSPQELNVKNFQTLSRLPAHRRSTDVEPPGHFVCRSQPLQCIECGEDVEIDQRDRSDHPKIIDPSPWEKNGEGVRMQWTGSTAAGRLGTMGDPVYTVFYTAIHGL